MIEILLVCSAVMCPEELVAYGVPLRAGQEFSSASLTQPGGWLRPFCFVNRAGESGYVRVIEWTDSVIRVEASRGVKWCNFSPATS